MTSFAFLSQDNFLSAPAPSAATPFAVAGVAWDGAVTNRPGARFGPRAIREASHMLCDATHPLFNVSPLGLLGDAGDLPLRNTSLAGMRSAMQLLVVELIRTHHICWLGGDHSITLALLRAYRARPDDDQGRLANDQLARIFHAARLPHAGVLKQHIGLTVDFIELAQRRDGVVLRDVGDGNNSITWSWQCAPSARRSAWPCQP